MFHFLVDYAVPVIVMLLMLIAGTRISGRDIDELSRHPARVVIGALVQLLFLPLIAVGLVQLLPISMPVAVGVLLLSLCPGGGISNYYCYLARCNVLFSAAVTAVGTMLALVTIPIWLTLLPVLFDRFAELPGLPVSTLISMLLALMAVPLALGAFLGQRWPDIVQRWEPILRTTSVSLVALLVLASVWTVRHDALALIGEISVVALLFILCAMSVGALVSHRLPTQDRHALMVEASVRNIGVALLLGRAVLDGRDFAAFAAWLTGYFVVEVIVMLGFVRYVETCSTRPDHHS